MITIKFRGKRIDNGEWVYGYLYELPLESGNVCMILTTDNIHEDNSIEPQYHLAFTLWKDLFVVDSSTVGQYTGLKDKNGKKIYAGDIIRAGKEKTLLEVRFVRGVFAFLWNGDLDDEFPCNAPTQEWAEVVGNIHDNPKMIKRK